MSTTEEQKETKKSSTKKEDRLRMMKSPQFYRKGFKEVRDQVEDTMQNQFKSTLVEDLKQNNYLLERDGVKVYLAKVRCARGT
jgi:4-hydroxy-3-methylbut-2-enyl diphosphate reductase